MVTICGRFGRAGNGRRPPVPARRRSMCFCATSRRVRDSVRLDGWASAAGSDRDRSMTMFQEFEKKNYKHRNFRVITIRTSGVSVGESRRGSGRTSAERRKNVAVKTESDGWARSSNRESSSKDLTSYNYKQKLMYSYFLCTRSVLETFDGCYIFSSRPFLIFFFFL